jgi:ABC-type uncharacterized transport system YnjBCD permease subunit
MLPVQVMIFLDCFTHCRKFDRLRPLISILLYISKRALALQLYTLVQKVGLLTLSKIDFPILLWSRNGAPPLAMPQRWHTVLKENKAEKIP